MEENKEKVKFKNPFVDESAFEGDEGPKPSEDETLMEEAKQNTEVVVVKTYMVPGMIIGAAIGTTLSSLIVGRWQCGMAVGMLVGLIIGLCIHKKPKSE